MKKWLIQLTTFFIIMIITVGAYNNPLSVRILEPLSETTQVTADPSDPLYQKIQVFAKKHHVAPSNARIDPVWKAIPGYNGIKVDVKASYKKMKKDNKFDPDKIVYHQIPPEIHLDNLPPAPIYKGNPEKPMVGFLINVAWGNEYIPEILKTLNKYQVKATFFLDGSWVKNNPDLAVMISEEGHQIGNHGFTHPDFSRLSREQVIQQLKRTNEAIEKTLGFKPKWFAPPSGSYNDMTVKLAAEMDMSTILWTVDTVDWKKPSPDEMVRRVNNKLTAGALILMHPTESVVKGLERMIANIHEKGYTIGMVSEVLSERRITD